MESKRFTLNQEDLIKITTGAGLALGGALITYLVEIIPQIDLGVWTPVFVAFMSVAINAFRKFLAEKE